MKNIGVQLNIFIDHSKHFFMIYAKKYDNKLSLKFKVITNASYIKICLQKV